MCIGDPEVRHGTHGCWNSAPRSGESRAAVAGTSNTPGSCLELVPVHARQMYAAGIAAFCRVPRLYEFTQRSDAGQSAPCLVAIEMLTLSAESGTKPA